MTRIITLTMNPALDLATTVARVEPFQKLRCAPERRHPGGGGINVARVVKRLGGEPLAIFPAGGATGHILEALVRKENVDARVIATVCDTREDFSVVETETGREFRFVTPGHALGASELASLLQAAKDACGEGVILVASGSLPPGAPPDCYAELAAHARACGARFVLDTSGPAFQATLNAGVHLTKPNRRELSEFAGASLEDMAAWLKASRDLVGGGHAELVALTLADRGALLVSRDDAFHAAAPKIAPVSTVGAGDSFLAALVWALSSGASHADALRHAVAAGSAALLAPGTELCRPEDIERLLPEVRADRV